MSCLASSSFSNIFESDLTILSRFSTSCLIRYELRSLWTLLSVGDLVLLLLYGDFVVVVVVLVATAAAAATAEAFAKVNSVDLRGIGDSICALLVDGTGSIVLNDCCNCCCCDGIGWPGLIRALDDPLLRFVLWLLLEVLFDVCEDDCVACCVVGLIVLNCSWISIM